MERFNCKKIILWLENGDRIELNNDEIKSLCILNVTQNFAIRDNYIYKYKECEDFILILTKNIYEKHYIDLNNEVSEDTIENRMKNQDISSIEIFFNENESESIFVVWNSESEYQNSYQSMLYSNNLLIIQCNKNEVTKKC